MHTHRPATRTPAPLRGLTQLLVAVLGIIALSTGTAAAAETDVNWTVRTASNKFGPARTSYSYNVNPGGTLNDALVVANHGTKPVRLAVYASDGYTTRSGQFDLLTTEKKSINIGAWVHTARPSVTIAAGKTVAVPFTLDLPDNATPGDYAGGIVTSLVQANDTEGINVDRRLGVRIKLRVGGELKPGLAIENLHAGYDGTLSPFSRGDATITYTIHNTGNAILSAQQSAAVTGPFGRLRARAGKVADTPQLLPGETWKVTVPVDGVAPSGRLSAKVALTPVLVDAAGSTSTLTAVNAGTHTWAIPWTLLLLVVVLIAVAAGVWVLSRRSRVRRRTVEDARVQEAVLEALRERETQPL